MTAEYRTQGAVAVITLTNPPVNDLNFASRTAAADGIARALADDAIKAIAITGAGKAIFGGADIKEFNSAQMSAEPSLHALIALVKSGSKPVVAALHHVCTLLWSLKVRRYLPKASLSVRPTLIWCI